MKRWILNKRECAEEIVKDWRTPYREHNGDETELMKHNSYAELIEWVKELWGTEDTANTCRYGTDEDCERIGM